MVKSKIDAKNIKNFLQYKSWIYFVFQSKIVKITNLS